MKKIYTIAVIMLLTASSTFAFEGNEYKVFAKLNNGKILSSLTKYLNIDTEQKDQLAYVFELTDKKLKSAFKNEDGTAADNAIWFNLANVKNILSDEQYKKYLISINMTVNTMNENSEIFIAEN